MAALSTYRRCATNGLQTGFQEVSPSADDAPVSGHWKQVKGVKEVSVSLEKKEAVVKYDQDVVKVEDLIKAVKNRVG